MFFFEFYEIFKNTFFHRTSLVAASVNFVKTDGITCPALWTTTVTCPSFHTRQPTKPAMLKLVNLLQKQPPEVFYKIYVLKYFAIFTGKYLCYSLWKLATLLKRGFNIGVFLGILRDFQEHLLWGTSANGCFCLYANHLSDVITRKSIH